MDMILFLLFLFSGIGALLSMVTSLFFFRNERRRADEKIVNASAFAYWVEELQSNIEEIRKQNKMTEIQLLLIENEINTAEINGDVNGDIN